MLKALHWQMESLLDRYTTARAPLVEALANHDVPFELVFSKLPALKTLTRPLCPARSTTPAKSNHCRPLEKIDTNRASPSHQITFTVWYRRTILVGTLVRLVKCGVASVIPEAGG